MEVGLSARKQIGSKAHPSNMQMQTYTYSPLSGKSAEADAKGRISYYEYDDFDDKRPGRQ